MSDYIKVIYPDGSERIGHSWIAVLGYVYESFRPHQWVEVVEISGDKQVIWVETTEKRSVTDD